MSRLEAFSVAAAPAIVAGVVASNDIGTRQEMSLASHPIRDCQRSQTEDNHA